MEHNGYHCISWTTYVRWGGFMKVWPYQTRLYTQLYSTHFMPMLNRLDIRVSMELHEEKIEKYILIINYTDLCNLFQLNLQSYYKCQHVIYVWYMFSLIFLVSMEQKLCTYTSHEVNGTTTCSIHVLYGHYHLSIPIWIKTPSFISKNYSVLIVCPI